MERSALESFKAAVASVLNNALLFGGSIALSIHVVLTFFRMHGLLLTLAFVTVWLISVSVYFRWEGHQATRRTNKKDLSPQRNSRKPDEPWRERQSA